ncbi:hypothetical protein SMICM17S_09226 [Streptomyces microflavus]
MLKLSLGVRITQPPAARTSARSCTAASRSTASFHWTTGRALATGAPRVRHRPRPRLARRRRPLGHTSLARPYAPPEPLWPGDDAVCTASAPHRPRPGQPTVLPGSRRPSPPWPHGRPPGRPLSGSAATWTALGALSSGSTPTGLPLKPTSRTPWSSLHPDGWPGRRTWTRDNQGYYFRRTLPRRTGTAADTFVSDPVTDERFAYYLGINNVLVSFGAQRLADEQDLLTVLRLPHRDRGTGLAPAAHPLEHRQLRCKVEPAWPAALPPWPAVRHPVRSRSPSPTRTPTGPRRVSPCLPPTRPRIWTRRLRNRAGATGGERPPPPPPAPRAQQAHRGSSRQEGCGDRARPCR